MRTRVDAAGAVDAQNAPTAPWKTAQHAVSHSAHTHRQLTRSAHEILDTPLIDGRDRGYLANPLYSRLHNLARAALKATTNLMLAKKRDAERLKRRRHPH
jgi:hypothetical protein